MTKTNPTKSNQQLPANQQQKKQRLDWEKKIIELTHQSFYDFMESFYEGVVDLWEQNGAKLNILPFKFYEPFKLKDIRSNYLDMYPNFMAQMDGFKTKFNTKFNGWIRAWMKHHPDFQTTNFSRHVGHYLVTFKKQHKHPLKGGIFYRFCEDICRIGEDLGKDRFNELCWIIGYLLHPVNADTKKAVILSDNGKNNRSGKSLLVKGMMHYLNQAHDRVGVNLDGKSFYRQDQFKFSPLHLVTELVHIDDVRANFDFEHILYQLQHEVTVNKKMHAPFKIDPKFVISTVDPINIESPSLAHKTIVFYLSNYYGEHKSPLQKYGLFFDNWSHDEWNRLCVFMQYCEQLYLENPSFNPSTPAT